VQARKRRKLIKTARGVIIINRKALVRFANGAYFPARMT
jgi:hypothetical protein